ncbi:MAG: hypothetical protein H7Y27_09115 [Gemmatimonadaceae bacterium]|nr:hypothetical protein [Chitinophagaceae bacterium]
MLLRRDGKYIQPSGSTNLEENDTLMILADNKELRVEIERMPGLQI